MRARGEMNPDLSGPEETAVSLGAGCWSLREPSYGVLRIVLLTYAWI
jgi:hypothetical protein